MTRPAQQGSETRAGSTAAALLAAQSTRFAGLDPLLPAAPAPPEGDVLTAALPDGERVAGVLVRTTLRPGTVPTLWSAMQTWELHPILGGTGRSGMAALLPQWRRLLDRVAPGADSAGLLSWPSRDAEAARPLLDHGLFPLSMLGVRTAGPPAPDRPTDGIVVRLADLSDVDSLVELALTELAYSATVGSAVLRPDARSVRRAALISHLEHGDPVWLAERDGIAVGLAEGWLVDSAAGSWTATRLPPGRWGYLNCLAVLPEARGGGVGRRLMDVAHRQLNRDGAIGTFLYYHPANPLASVFWARQGYRPLWTNWEVRPAGALR